MSNHEMKCPLCKFEFKLDEDYQSGNCPNCNENYYYWDHVYDEESGDLFFEGYYWNEN